MVIRVAIVLLLLVRIGCAQEESVEHPKSGSGAAPDKLALLVGIGDYPEGGAFQDLRGAENDPGLIRDLLVDRFGFAPENVKILLNEEATHEQIVRGFNDWLIRRAGPDTEAVFWYSGHGSRVPDRSGVGLAEVDDMDSTLVAWDSRLEDRNGSFDIPDDELGSLIRALSRKTDSVTIVTDCCHSGGVTRGGPDGTGGAVRAAPAGEQPFDRKLIEPFWPENVPYLDDDQTDLEPSQHVHIAACGPRQGAREFNPGYEGVYYGALSYFLHYRMQNLRHDTTYFDLVGSVNTWVTARFPNQSVHFSGPIDRVVFEDRYEQRPPGFLAHARFDQPEEAGDPQILLSEVGIDAGRLFGLRRGSVVQLRDFEGQELGTATVRRLSAATSVALLDGELPASFGARGIMATEISRPGGHERLAVVISHPALARRIQEVYGDRIRILNRPQDGPTYRIEVDPPEADEQDPALTRFIAPNGFLIWPGPSETVRDGEWLQRITDKLSLLLDSEYRYLGLLELTRLTGGLRVACTFAEPTPNELVRGTDVARDWPLRMVNADVRPMGRGMRGRTFGTARSTDFSATHDPALDRRQLVRVEVTNDTDQPLFFNVLSVTEAREITVIAPGEGRTLQIPAHESRPVYATLTRHDGFEPGVPMRDRYLVVATTQWANFYPLVQPSTNRGASDLGALPAVIENALSTEVTRTRGGSRPVKTNRGATYGIASVDLLVDTREDSQK